MNTLLGIKKTQTQRFLEDGTRIPVTKLDVSSNIVVFVKQKDKNGYLAVQLGFGTRKNANKALLGHGKGAGIKTAPRFLREVRIMDETATLPNFGDIIKASDVFKPGDIIDVIGISKGKGYAGVVKRHHFKGGPRTHGQSDRERAPGSIGQTTTPGRVYKGKRMSGRMGSEKVTIKNLLVMDVSDSELFIKGLVPGIVDSLIVITKVGEGKKFVPLYKDVSKDEEVSKVSKGETEEIQVESLEADEKTATTETQKEEVQNETEEAPAVVEAMTDKEEEKENAS